MSLSPFDCFMDQYGQKEAGLMDSLRSGAGRVSHAIGGHYGRKAEKVLSSAAPKAKWVTDTISAGDAGEAMKLQHKSHKAKLKATEHAQAAYGHTQAASDISASIRQELEAKYKGQGNDLAVKAQKWNARGDNLMPQAPIPAAPIPPSPVPPSIDASAPAGPVQQARQAIGDARQYVQQGAINQVNRMRNSVDAPMVAGIGVGAGLIGGGLAVNAMKQSSEESINQANAAGREYAHQLINSLH